MGPCFGLTRYDPSRSFHNARWQRQHFPAAVIRRAATGKQLLTRNPLPRRQPVMACDFVKFELQKIGLLLFIVYYCPEHICAVDTTITSHWVLHSWSVRNLSDFLRSADCYQKDADYETLLPPTENHPPH